MEKNQKTCMFPCHLVPTFTPHPLPTISKGEVLSPLTITHVRKDTRLSSRVEGLGMRLPHDIFSLFPPAACGEGRAVPQGLPGAAGLRWLG